MMPHPKRNNFEFKKTLLEILFGSTHKNFTAQTLFDKSIKELMFSEQFPANFQKIFT